MSDFNGYYRDHKMDEPVYRWLRDLESQVTRQAHTIDYERALRAASDKLIASGVVITSEEYVEFIGLKDKLAVATAALAVWTGDASISAGHLTQAQ